MASDVRNAPDVGRDQAADAAGRLGRRRRLREGRRRPSGGAVVLTCAPSRSPPSMAAPSASRSAPAPNSAAMRPSKITRMRSESDRTSSSSSETRRIARPSSRSVMSRRWTYSMAPTSRPRVGCEATSTAGSRETSRAMMTFCWLPPESDAAGAFGPPPRTSNSVSSGAAAASMRRGKSQPCDDDGGLSKSWSAMFSARLKSMTSPRCWRSVGMWPQPASSTSCGLAPVMSCPSTMIVPDVGARRPAIASISSAWPLPSTPARPTISPARTSRDRPRTTSRSRSSWTTRSVHLEPRLGGLGGGLVDRQDDLAADHELGEASPRSRPPWARSPMYFPRRRTVTRSAMSSTSLSLWVMKMTDVPCAVRLRRMADQLGGLLRASGPRSARRGSGCRRRGRAPSGSRRAAACRP